MLLFEAADENGKVHVLGGYSSHGWDITQKGDNTCFLFNLTENLKFTSISRTYMDGSDAYTWVSKDAKKAQEETYSHIKTAKHELHFGPKELVVKNDFQ